MTVYGIQADLVLAGCTLKWIDAKKKREMVPLVIIL